MRISLILFLFPFLVTAQNNGRKVFNTGYLFTFDGFTTEFAEVSWAPGCDSLNETPAITDDGSVEGSYTITTDGEQASWEHVELSLVDAAGLNNNSVDLSKEALQKISVTFSATQDAEIMMVFSDDVTIHPTEHWHLAADNVPALLMDYEASMGEITITNNTDTYSGNDSIEGSFGFGVFQSDSVLQSRSMYNIDSTAISELWVYYRMKGEEPTCDASNLQVAGTLTLKEVCLGKCDFSEIADGEAPFDAYPNPTEGVIHLSLEQDEVTLIAVSGVVIGTYENVSEIDLSNLRPGFYLLDTYYGYKVIEKR